MSSVSLLLSVMNVKNHDEFKREVSVEVDRILFEKEIASVKKLTPKMREMYADMMPFEMFDETSYNPQTYQELMAPMVVLQESLESEE